MILIKPSFSILTMTENAEQLIERAGRTCYKSEDLISLVSAKKFCKMLKKNEHFSVIEHATMTVKFICDRGISHELVRHRLASYSQESTRYCNYSKDKFGNQITYVIPPWIGIVPEEYKINPISYEQNSNLAVWLDILLEAEATYFSLLKAGWRSEMARSVLPNALKTEIIVTANFREWYHIFNLRCSPIAHPQMRELMIPLRDKCIELYPSIFGDDHE